MAYAVKNKSGKWVAPPRKSPSQRAKEKKQGISKGGGSAPQPTDKVIRTIHQPGGKRVIFFASGKVRFTGTKPTGKTFTIKEEQMFQKGKLPVSEAFYEKYKTQEKDIENIRKREAKEEAKATRIEAEEKAFQLREQEIALSQKPYAQAIFREQEKAKEKRESEAFKEQYPTITSRFMAGESLLTSYDVKEAFGDFKDTISQRWETNIKPLFSGADEAISSTKTFGKQLNTALRTGEFRTETRDIKISPGTESSWLLSKENEMWREQQLEKATQFMIERIRKQDMETPGVSLYGFGDQKIVIQPKTTAELVGETRMAGDFTKGFSTGVTTGIREQPLKAIGITALAATIPPVVAAGKYAAAPLIAKIPTISKVVGVGLKVGLPVSYGVSVAGRVGMGETAYEKGRIFGGITSTELVPIALGVRLTRVPTARITQLAEYKTVLAQMPKAQAQQYIDYRNLAKGIKQPGIKDVKLTSERIPKGAKPIIEKYLLKKRLLVGGSEAIRTQTILKGKSADVDIFARFPKLATKGLVKQLTKAGFKPTYFTKGTGQMAKGEISFGTGKAVEIHTKLWAKMFPYYKSPAVTPKGFLVPRARELGLRSWAGGFMSGRTKDIPRFWALVKAGKTISFTPTTGTGMVAPSVAGAMAITKPYSPYYQSVKPIGYSPYKKYKPYSPSKYTPYQEYKPYKYSPYQRYVPYKYTPYQGYSPYKQTPYSSYSGYKGYGYYQPTKTAYTPYAGYGYYQPAPQQPTISLLKIPELEPIKRKKTKGIGIGREYKYQPSLVAKQLKIFGMKPKQVSGLEIRPIEV